MRLKLLQKEQFKTAEATVDLIGNKIANRIIKVSKSPQQNNLETVTNEKEIYEKNVSPNKDRKLLMI